MCIVTYIPLDKTVFITHNRDEKSSRTKAIIPKEYIINGYTILFPRDSAAGGSWIAINKNGAAAVLLNGGFTKHVHRPPYKKSRGLAFLDIIAANDLFLSYNKVDLAGIEPFTVILWSNYILYECRWDGKQKHINKPDAGKPHTWSSVTLYGEEVIARRNEWFDKWLQLHPRPSMENIIQFHLSAGDGDKQNDLRMNRNDDMLTVSITAMEISESKSIMQYLDLQDNTRSVQEFNFTKAAAIQ
ncbi:MAG: NRDE family protein [Chitinophagaceae bacterium]